MKHSNNKHLFTALEACYTEFKPTKKRARKSAGKAASEVGLDHGQEFIDIDNFDDPLADCAPPAGVALASAAREALAAGAAGH